MQLLNLSIFRAIKALYQKAIRKINAGNTNKILRYKCINIYMQTRSAVISELNILSEWQKNEIYLINRLISLSSYL